jgi:hypothetical protein
MPFAPTSIRGFALNVRFAVNGIHSSSSDCDETCDDVAGVLCVSEIAIGLPRDLRRQKRVPESDDDAEEYVRPGWAGVGAITDDKVDKLAEVQRRLREMRAHKRGEMRWTVSSHTAELAIGAIEQTRPPKAPAAQAQVAASKALQAPSIRSSVLQQVASFSVLQRPSLRSGRRRYCHMQQARTSPECHI